MTYDILQSSTQAPLMFLMVQSSDHITGLTGASPTVTISKAGGAFASPSGAVTEVSSGWYKVAGNATDTGTLGPLALHATAASGDPTDILIANIVSYNPQSATNLGLSALPTANPGAANGVFIAGANVATSIAGTAASGGTPAVAALTLTGGAASTTGGGVASSGLLVTGGAGAASTNGAIDAATFIAGGTNTVASTASGIKTTGTSTGHGILATSGGGATGDGIKAVSAATAGNGMTLAHNGSGVNDFNATTTPLTLAKTTNITGFNDITAAAAATGIWQDTTAGDFTVSASVGKSLMNGVALGTGLKIQECILTDTTTTVTNQLTAAAIATGVWQDTTAGDFTVSASVGKSVMNGVALGSGLKIAECVLTDTTTTVTNQLTAAAIATGIWQDATAGDFTAASSIGKSLYTSGNAPGAANGLFIAGTNAATAITGGLTAHLIGTVDTLTTYTGNTPQTGDCYARLGAPVGASVSADIAEIEAETDALLAGVIVTTNNDKTGYALTSAYDFAKGTTTMTESYAAQGTPLTPAQALYQLVQQAGQMSISGTLMTVLKRDEATTAKTFTLNSATTPTSIVETT